MVAGGGRSPDGTRWISCRAGFFWPVRVLSGLFPRLFLEHLVKALDAGKLEFFSSLELLRERGTFLRHLAVTREAEWVVYSKRPFAGPEQVLDYVGRYTRRVAISKNRLLEIEKGKVTLRYKDYRHHDQQKTMPLEAEEFPAGHSPPRSPAAAEAARSRSGRTRRSARPGAGGSPRAAWGRASRPLPPLRPRRARR